ncbi:MAG: M1 family metallopeptidase [Chloroflexota bacterium]|nr:M1 family metallopeptidase [Chloroflexota bacterium]
MLRVIHRLQTLVPILIVPILLLPSAGRTETPDPPVQPLSTLTATPGTPSPITGRTGDTNPELYAAILPEHRERIYAQTQGKLSRYRITATVEPRGSDQPALVSGTLQLRYVNETATPRDEIYFRLYPNAPAYAEAEMSVSSLSVAGSPVVPVLSVDNTVLQVALLDPLPPGAATDLELTFAATVPVRPMQTYGIFAVDPSTGTIALAHWFPLLAGYDESGWSLHPVSRNGDPIFSNTALFDVRLRTPEDWQVAATGIESERTTAGGVTSRRLISGPVRDFTVVTSDRFESISRDVAGTTVTSYLHPERASGGEAVLNYGATALSVYNELLIPYPYREMDLVEVELYGAGGVEFPQLMLMARSLYANDHSRNEHYLEFVTAHEVGHQWFFSMVGNNQHLDAFIDEGLVEYLSTDVYFTAVHGAETGRRQFGLEVLLWYLGMLRTGRDMVVDQPTDSFSNSSIYAAAVYAKGAIGFAEIHDLIGNDAFFSALRHYTTDNMFGVGTPGALLSAFEAESDRDAGAVWTLWFEQENGAAVFDEQDYQELMVELGLR